MRARTIIFHSQNFYFLNFLKFFTKRSFNLFTDFSIRFFFNLLIV